MQKFSGFIAASALVASGLVAATGTAAHAGPTYDPGSVPSETGTTLKKRIEKCDSNRITVDVANDTNREARGKVLLVVRRDRGGFRYTDVQKLRNGQTTFVTPDLCKPRGYTVKAKYNAAKGSRWKDSKSFDSFRVKRR